MGNAIVVRPDASRMTESLRDTGYEFNVAIADIIDNSISAKATKIDVNIILDPISNEPKVYIADNGCGMNEEELKNAMKYGSDSSQSETYLNKFGFGLKTGSTAFCRKLSVVSKSNESEYNKVTWDLDHISKVNEWELLISAPTNDEICLLETTTSGSAGTLVIWENVDRLFKGYEKSDTLKKAFKRTIASLSFHLGMVFQRFLDPSFNTLTCTITVNSKKIDPWDPFFMNESATKVVAERDQEVVIDNEVKTFHIKAVVLPRPEEWSSIEVKKSARISNPFEGFYVYRENRLIHFGDWLDMFVSESHVSLLRVEFSFGHELDDLFNVDIKKSRIMLNEAIYDFLRTKFLPAPRQTAIEVYNSLAAKKAKVNAEGNGLHKLSNKTIEDKKEEVISSLVEVLNKNTGEVKISNQNGSAVGTLKILEEPETTEKRVIVREKEDDAFLWEAGLINGEHAVILNSKHPFYYKVYSRAENNVATTAIDLLIWSLAEAELSTYTSEVKEQYKDMRYQVSSKLKRLVDVLPDPEGVTTE